MAAEGRRKGKTQTARPKGRSACVVPPSFTPKRMPRAVKPLSLQSDLPRALSESPCSPWAIPSDGGTRFLFFQRKLIYMDYYRRFSPGCQRISFFIRSTFPAAPAPARCQRPPCGQSSNRGAHFFQIAHVQHEAALVPDGKCSSRLTIRGSNAVPEKHILKIEFLRDIRRAEPAQQVRLETAYCAASRGRLSQTMPLYGSVSLRRMCSLSCQRSMRRPSSASSPTDHGS